ncbi:right-handed parallel beta-helix repeat-containing protein, partial [Acaryochloris sp. IP29b_bin.137]|uniref:right-handed parallel beta-helix repeat-containing protein n=1 Tax=Acaryochloris sp. IP29b_bin.137 TaxID=2969217 RepID=UPI0026105DB6
NTFDTGVQVSTRFQDHFLVLDTFRERQSIRQFEAAMAGVDLEAGVKLAQWDRGNLRAFGGLYFYDAPGSSGTVGWRLRLQAEPTENFGLGLAVQDDDLFGTNVVFSLKARLPGIRPRDALTKTERVIARLRESWTRTDSITIDHQQEVEFLSEQSSGFLMNPEEEQPYFFQHVKLGKAGGDGTFENPFGTVQAALDATRRDGNDIVYVDGEADIPIPAFRIPDRVQVLSQGPRQILAGMPFSTFPRATVRLPFDSSANFENGILVELPFSGDGNFPQITGGGPDLVTLGNRTVLAGFRVDAAAGNGIIGSNIRQVELRNNIIRNSGERGIFLNDVGGEVVMFDNVVTGSQGTAPDSGQGIFILNTTTLSASDVVIAGYQANNNRVGIEIAAIGDIATTQVPSQIIDIGPSSSDNTSIGTSGDVPIDNTISNNAAQGLHIRAANLGIQEISITNSTVSNNGGPGIEVDGGTLGGSSTAFQEVFIRNNVIQNNNGAGIDIEANETVFQEAVIDNNVIRNNTGAGIVAEARQTSFQEFITDSDNGSFGISNNLISNNGGQGIDLNSSGLATQAADINNNSLAGNNTTPSPDAAGIAVTANDITNKTCVVASGNTVPEGIRLSTTSVVFPVQALFQVGDRDNLSVNNNNAPVQLLNSVTMLEDPAAFDNIAQTTCFP